jgi:hypothetical protein
VRGNRRRFQKRPAKRGKAGGECLGARGGTLREPPETAKRGGVARKRDGVVPKRGVVLSKRGGVALKCGVVSAKRGGAALKCGVVSAKRGAWQVSGRRPLRGAGREAVVPPAAGG